MFDHHRTHQGSANRPQFKLCSVVCTILLITGLSSVSFAAGGGDKGDTAKSKSTTETAATTADKGATDETAKETKEDTKKDTTAAKEGEAAETTSTEDNMMKDQAKTMTDQADQDKTEAKKAKETK